MQEKRTKRQKASPSSLRKIERRIHKGKEVLDLFSKTLANVKVQSEFSKFIDAIKGCEGKIVTTGMGKAGVAMRKFSSTLCSLGIPSCYLHPGEASHGDLGVITKDDILFVASTSGKTREVLETIRLVKRINSKPILSITSHPDSPLRKLTDVVLDMGMVEEAGELKLAPTTSIIVMLALTDALATVLSDEMGFSRKDFSYYHHSGYLGALARDDGRIY